MKSQNKLLCVPYSAPIYVMPPIWPFYNPPITAPSRLLRQFFCYAPKIYQNFLLDPLPSYTHPLSCPVPRIVSLHLNDIMLLTLCTIAQYIIKILILALFVLVLHIASTCLINCVEQSCARHDIFSKKKSRRNM